MSDKLILRLAVMGGLLTTVLIATEFSATAQEVGSQAPASGQAQDNDQSSESVENEAGNAEQKALEAEIAAVEKVLATGDKNDVEQVLSEYETEKPLPADVALSLPSDI